MTEPSTVLTKHQILSGAAVTETVHIDRLDGDVLIRPLTDGEATQCQTMALKGLSVSAKAPQGGAKPEGDANPEGDAKPDADSMGIDMDLSALSDAQAEAKRFAVACALSVAGVKWSSREVGQMPSGAPDEIYRHVVKLTGTDPIADSSKSEELEAAARFREDG